METTIERINRVPLRQIWRHEAHDFTKWLTDNIDVLSGAIGEELTNPEREQSTGNFNVDIKAEDSSGDTVIIENQYGKSDHDHLGKLITYLTAFEAKKAIWIVEDPRPEHIGAITWLNEGDNNCDFYLLKIEAIKIGNSNPAPLVTKIVGPSEEIKQVGKIKKDDSERDKLRHKFWTMLLEYAKTQHNLFNSISPTKDHWIAASAGSSGIAYTYWITQKGLRVEFRIDKGKDSEEENLRIFNKLHDKKEIIEAKFGEPLIWNRSEGNRMCAIRVDLADGGYKSTGEEWSSIIAKAVDKMVKLEIAFKSWAKKV
jgi:hypothetical protein